MNCCAIHFSPIAGSASRKALSRSRRSPPSSLGVTMARPSPAESRRRRRRSRVRVRTARGRGRRVVERSGAALALVVARPRKRCAAACDVAQVDEDHRSGCARDRRARNAAPLPPPANRSRSPGPRATHRCAPRSALRRVARDLERRSWFSPTAASVATCLQSGLAQDAALRVAPYASLSSLRREGPEGLAQRRYIRRKKVRTGKMNGNSRMSRSSGWLPIAEDSTRGSARGSARAAT